MKRSPAAAFWLSLLPGVGHFYLGQFKKGLTCAVLVAGAILFAAEVSGAFFGILIPVLWLFAMLDAHQSAHAVNAGIESADQVNLFSGASSKWWGGVLIAMGVLFLLYNFDLFDIEWLWQFWPVVLILVGIRLIKPGSAAKPAPETLPPEESSSPSEPNELDAARYEGEENERADEGDGDVVAKGNADAV
jgi:hypothetical protein